MSVFGKVTQQIRTLLRNDKDSKILRHSRGVNAPLAPGTMGDLMQAYGHDVVSDYLRLEYDLLSRYLDYEWMDDHPFIAAALDIYAEDATQPDTPSNKRLWIESPDKGLEMLLNDLVHRQLRLEDQLKPMARAVVTYGNYYGEITVAGEGVIQVRDLSPATMRRVEGPRGALYGFVQDFARRVGYTPEEYMRLMREYRNGPAMVAPRQVVGLQQAVPFEHWEIVHMRISSKPYKSVYGMAVSEPARWAWKRLTLLEDAALVYRLQRSPQRFAYYVDIGNRPTHEALQLLHTARQQFKKKKFVNPKTGQVDLRWESLAPDQDIFIPSQNGNASTRIETLSTPSWQVMDDVEYFRSSLFAAMKVPKAYLSQEEGVNRNILSSEDVRFARSVMSVQQELRYGIAKICRVHLAAIGIDPSRVRFDVRLTVPSAIFELAQLEVRNARADLASRVTEQWSQRKILRDVYNLNDSDIEEVFKERAGDYEREAVAQAKAQAAAQKEAPDSDGGGGMFASRMHNKLVNQTGLREDQVLPGLSTGSLSPIPTSGKAKPSLRRTGRARNEDRAVEQDLQRLTTASQSQGKQLSEMRGLLRQLVAASRPVAQRR